MNRRIEKKRSRVQEEQTAKLNFYVQYKDMEYLEQQIVEEVKKDWKEHGNAKEIKELSIYLKPEEKKAYYTVNGTDSGAVEL